MVRRRWRDYTTESGRRPVKEFLDGLDDADLASVVAAMVRADGRGVIYRVLFAPQGKNKQVLLSLEGFRKKTQKTPAATIRSGEAAAEGLGEPGWATQSEQVAISLLRC